MAESCARCPLPGAAADAVVAVHGRSARADAQCADILLCEVPDRDVAGQAIAGIFADFPGCVAVAAVSGPWGLLAVRTGWCRCLVARALFEMSIRREQ